MRKVAIKKIFTVFTMLAIICLFVSGQAFAWTLTSNFDSGTTGANASGTSGFSYAGDKTTIDNTHSHSGTNSAKFHWDAHGGSYDNGAEGFTHQHGEFTGLSGTSNGVWARAYFYFPVGFNFTAWPASKLIRIGDIGGRKVSIYINNANGSPSDPGKLLYSNEIANTQGETTLSSTITTGVWHCIELYDRQSPSPINRIWLDGVMVYNNTTDITYNSGNPSSINDVLFMSQWNNWDENAGYSQDQWIDDVVVTTDTPAGRDAAGNPMIGLTNVSTGTVLPPPTGLKVAAQ